MLLRLSLNLGVWEEHPSPKLEVLPLHRLYLGAVLALWCLNLLHLESRKRNLLKAALGFGLAGGFSLGS